MNGECIGWEGDEPIYLIVYINITDITEQRELQKKLEKQSKQLKEALKSAEQANQAKSDFLARMSHDIPYTHERHHGNGDYSQSPCR